jgi:hypothetical protein
MNCYAYPLIFETVKNNQILYLSIFLYDSIINITKKNGVICVTGDKKEIYSSDTFNFYSNKPIDKITIVYDNYGASLKDIFNREHFKAATIIQKIWKKNYKKEFTLDFKFENDKKQYGSFRILQNLERNSNVKEV